MSNPNKILFLDIDGVLNSSRTMHVHGGPSEFGGMPRGGGAPHDFSEDGLKKFDSVAIGLVRQLCIETGCSIVLSSSWRILHTVSECAVGLNLPIFDKTPRIPELPYTRGSEIQSWLNEHSEVEMYAIVDDDSDMLDSQKENFVHVDGREGLLYRDFVALRNILSGRPSGHRRTRPVCEELND